MNENNNEHSVNNNINNKIDNQFQFPLLPTIMSNKKELINNRNNKPLFFSK